MLIYRIFNVWFSKFSIIRLKNRVGNIKVSKLRIKVNWMLLYVKFFYTYEISFKISLV